MKRTFKDPEVYVFNPTIPARRGATEYEANRRWRQCLENQLIGAQGFSTEQAEAQVKSQRPWLYQENNRHPS